MQYIKFILIGVVLFFVTRLIPRIISRILNKKNKIESFRKIYMFAEFILWTAFIFWALKEVFEEKFYFTTIMTGIVVIVTATFGFYVLRDFVAGMILKTEYNLKEGGVIKFEDTAGLITEAAYLSMELETEEHEKMKIPYSKIIGKKIVIPNPAESLKKFVLKIKVPVKTDIISVKKQLKIKMLNSSWTAVTEIPDIKLENENLNYYDFKIIVFAQNKNHAQRIRQNMSAFEQLKN